MATISYKYEPPKAVLASIEKAKHTYEAVRIAGGFDPDTSRFTPLKLDDKAIAFPDGKNSPEVPGWAIFETLAAAMEAGIVDSEMWPTQLFADVESYRDFVHALRDYEVCYKLVDPWWSALRALVGGGDEEEGFSTAADLAERFVEVLEDLPEQWA